MANSWNTQSTTISPGQTFFNGWARNQFGSNNPFFNGLVEGIGSSMGMSPSILPTGQTENPFGSSPTPDTNDTLKTAADLYNNEDFKKLPETVQTTIFSNVLNRGGEREKIKDQERLLGGLISTMSGTQDRAAQAQERAAKWKLPYEMQALNNKLNAQVAAAVIGNRITPPLVSFNPEQRSWGPGGPRVV